MAIALEQFVKNLEDSGIVSPSKIQLLLLPPSSAKTADELARELVKQNHLTRFQAQAIYQGRAGSLIVGSYTLLDKIGEGGMGQVFKAQHRRMDRLVAIKMLPVAMTKDAASVARFEREVKAAAKLNHPNIVSSYDADLANGAHFLVMEYVEGVDLQALVKKDGPLSVAKAVGFILQAAKGLEFAHKKGIVHRDIKPGNLLRDNEGTIKILDMGLARISSGGDVAANTDLTATGTMMGTVDYMAPEQATAARHVDARADIYSLGCTLYYLLSGRTIYEGETIIEKLLAHRERPIPSLADVRMDVPADVEAIFRKMVAKAVDDRYQSMGEAAADFERYQASLSAGSRATFATGSSASDSEASDLSMAWGQSLLRPLPTPEPYQGAIATELNDGGEQSPLWKNTKMRIAAGAAGVLVLLVGVVAMVGSKNPKENVQSNVPAGGAAEVAPATPQGGVSLERQILDWWFVKRKEPGAHGYMSIRVAGEARPVYSERDVPVGPFQIESLGLGPMSDEELKSIGQLHDLADLSCEGSPVTDQGLKHLTNLTSLKRLVLRSTQITADGVADLRKSLPTCKVDWP